MRVACFFFPHFVVQVEARDDGSLRERPVVIGGLPYERKAVCDASKEALACGIRQGMLLREAYALCPQGVFLPPDEGKYADAFTAVLTLLTKYSPVVEAAHWGLRPQTPRGLRPQTAQGLRPQTPGGLRPQTAQVLCPQTPGGLRPQTAQGLRPQAHRRTAAVGMSPAEYSVFIDVSNEGPDDSAELQLVEEIRQTIEKRLRLYPFVSIASNKFVARAAGRIAGPGQVMVVDGEEGKDFLKDLPVCLLPASSVTLERLELLGIYRIGQLADLSPAALSLEFGNEGRWLWELSSGIDGSRLTPWSEAPVLKDQICFEPAAESMDRVLAGCDRLLTGLSRQLKERWQSCLRLTISMHFSNDRSIGGFAPKPPEADRSIGGFAPKPPQVDRSIGPTGRPKPPEADRSVGGFAPKPPVVQRVFHFKEATSSREEMLRHLKQYLESAKFTSPVSEMRLTLIDLCPESGRQVPISPGFLDERVKHRERLASAISRLRQRYGKAVVGRVVARPNSVLPEDSFSFTELDL